MTLDINLDTHDSFSFPYNHANSYGDEPNEETYWPYLNHHWEEGSFILVEKVVQVYIRYDPSELQKW